MGKEIWLWEIDIIFRDRIWELKKVDMRETDFKGRLEELLFIREQMKKMWDEKKPLKDD